MRIKLETLSPQDSYGSMWEHWYASLRRVLRNKLSSRQKLSLRLLRSIVVHPAQFQTHLNRLRYFRGVHEKPEISYVPPVIAATITDQCNLRCPNCFYILHDPDYFFSSFISPDKFRQVLEKYNRPRKAEILFLTGGEPLMHPKIDELIDIAKSYNLRVKMSTNGVLVKRKLSSLSKLDYLSVSMDSYDHDTFKKYRAGHEKQFDMILEGLKALKENNINFAISFVLSEENLHESSKMIEFAERMGPSLVTFHNISPHGSTDFRPLSFQSNQTVKWLEELISRRDYPFDINLPAIFDLESPSFREVKCIQPWYYFCFNSVGDVSYCCHLPHDPKIGNVFAGYDFNSREMTLFRKETMTGKMTSDLIQKNCLHCQRRFMGKEFGIFDSRVRTWFFSNVDALVEKFPDVVSE